MRSRKDTVILERRFVPAGQTIIKEGEYGAQAFLIQSGQVRVSIQHEDKEMELAVLGAGQIVGEMALIFDGPRTASVQVIEDSNLIVITRAQFSEKLKATDSTIRAVVNMLARRILDVNNTLINRKNDLDSLKQTGRVIYQNVVASLPKSQQRAFAKTVLPKLEALIESIEAFEDCYGDVDDNNV